MKLFIGNLADTVDSTKLKQVFQPFTTITECDVVKNYAFIHVPDEDVETVMSRLNGYTIEGKAIQIKHSTSKLRPVPGLTSQNCLRCTSTAHRTPQCPDDPNNKISHTIKIDLTKGIKREADHSSSPAPPAKRVFAIMDDEIPRPAESELQQLYEEYNLSRQRYTYYRDRLLKEIDDKRGVGNVFANSAPSGNTNQLSSAPISYQTNATILPSYSMPTGTSGSHPYSTTLKAPYTSAVSETGSSPYGLMTGGTAPYAIPPVSTAVLQNPNSMTPQQFLQQQAMAQPGPYGQPPPSQQPTGAGQYGSPGAPYVTNPRSTQPWMQQQHQSPIQPLMGLPPRTGGLVKLNIT